MKYLFTILILITAHACFCQSSVYDTKLKLMSGDTLLANDYRGKKLLVVTQSLDLLQQTKTGAYWDSVQLANPSIQILLIPIVEAKDSIAIDTFPIRRTDTVTIPSTPADTLTQSGTTQAPDSFVIQIDTIQVIPPSNNNRFDSLYLNSIQLGSNYALQWLGDSTATSNLVQWITNSDFNHHFDVTLGVSRTMYFINEVGVLYGVLNDVASNSLINQLLQQKTVATDQWVAEE